MSGQECSSTKADFICAVRVPGGVNCRGNVHGHRIRSRLHDKKMVTFKRSREEEKIMKRNKMKKKGIALLLALTMAAAAMTGCGDKKESEPVKELDFADIAGDTTNDADNAPESPDVEESFTEQAEEETREGMYRSEITNEWIDESLKNQRPIAVMVDNEKLHCRIMVSRRQMWYMSL